MVNQAANPSGQITDNYMPVELPQTMRFYTRWRYLALNEPLRLVPSATHTSSWYHNTWASFLIMAKTYIYCSSSDSYRFWRPGLVILGMARAKTDCTHTGFASENISEAYATTELRNTFTLEIWQDRNTKSNV